jgi:hypothetical protein
MWKGATWKRGRPRQRFHRPVASMSSSTSPPGIACQAISGRPSAPTPDAGARVAAGEQRQTVADLRAQGLRGGGLVEQREHLLGGERAEEIALGVVQLKARSEALQHRRGFADHPLVGPAITVAVRLPVQGGTSDFASPVQVGAVFLQPLVQAGPVADQCFVGDLDGLRCAAGVAAGDQQAGGRQLVDQRARYIVEVD